MTFDRWFDLPVWLVFLSLALGFGFSAVLIYWLSFGTLTRATAAGFVGVVAPFFGSVAILFALLTGFLANDVWERNRLAHRAILAERQGILSVYAMSVATVTDMSDIRLAVRAYGQQLVDDEWPRMMSQESSPKAEELLRVLLAKVSDPRVGVEAGSAAQFALLDTVLKLQSSRHDRLSVSDDRTDRTKWAAVLLLALITQAAIAIVHLERPKAQLASLSIFTLAVIVTLGLVAIRERPFDGVLRYTAEPLAEALQIMTPVAPRP